MKVFWSVMKRLRSVTRSNTVAHGLKELCRRCTTIYTVDHHNIGLPLNRAQRHLVFFVRLICVFVFSVTKNTDNR